jgi:hypothetical protein
MTVWEECLGIGSGGGREKGAVAGGRWLGGRWKRKRNLALYHVGNPNPRLGLGVVLIDLS